MESAYAAAYQALATRHWWWRAREAVVLDAIRRYRPSQQRLRILDVGCGPAALFDHLLEIGEVTGVEADATLVEAAGSHRARIYVGPFDKTFPATSRYSLVLMLDVLEHMSDPLAALRRLHAVLEPGGVWIATVPAFRALWTRHDDLNAHVDRYRRRTFRVLADAASLRVERMEYFFHWLFPTKLVVRALEAVTGGAPRVPRIPPRFINEALYELSWAERRLLHRLHLPFGTSLLAVGTVSADSGPH